ncbi:MAG: C4-dicarboxylate ABC transporter [Proteobacteria bacterium]|nr:C4-dicarboxylate ABC transporter [Pseudomonadota bacterium]
MKKLLAWLLVAAALPLSAHAQTFKIATLSPDGSFWVQEIRSAADAIEKRTDGRVTFKIYAGGVMGSDDAVLRKIRLGQLQGGAVTTGALSAAYADAAIYGMPFKFNSFAEVDFVRAKMDKMILDGIEAGGLVPFGLAEGGFAYIMSKSPIRSVADLKSSKVWAPSNDNLSIETLKELGVTPVTLGLGDVLTSLQTGIVDTVATSPVGALALQWHTGVKYMTELPVVYFSALMVLDGKAFAKAKPEDQKVIREELGKAFAGIDKRNRSDNVAAMAALKNQGIEVVTPTSAELESWYGIREVALKVNDRIQMFSKGGLKMVDDYLQTYRTQHAMNDK